MSQQFAMISAQGNVGKVEAKFAPDGTMICESSLATNFTRKNEKFANWYNFTVWEKQAEMFNQFVKKGTFLRVDGVLEIESWNDKEGVTHTRNIIKVLKWSVLGNGKGRDENSDNPYDEATPDVGV